MYFMLSELLKFGTEAGKGPCLAWDRSTNLDEEEMKSLHLALEVVLNPSRTAGVEDCNNMYNCSCCP